MKMFTVSVYKNGEFQVLFRTSKEKRVREEINAPDNRYEFIRVDNFTHHESGIRSGERQLINVSIYLGGSCILRDYEIMPNDIEEFKKTAECVYKIDGRVLYLPHESLSTPALKEVLGLSDDEWFSINIVQDGPPAYAVVTYDWESTNRTRQKIKNVKASARFGMDLYGDVLFTDENLIS
jgi:hypothetical protein